MTDDLLKAPKGKMLKLADGAEYTLSPLDLTTMASLEEEFDCDIDELPTKLVKRSATSFRKLLWIFLRDNYPEITLSTAGKLVTIEIIDTVIGELLSALEGLKV